MKEPATFTEEQLWEHTSKHGTKFVTRCDFEGGITVHVSDVLTNEKLLEDVTEMIGCHSLKVRGNLRNFKGYKRASYTIKRF